MEEKLLKIKEELLATDIEKIESPMIVAELKGKLDIIIQMFPEDKEILQFQMAVIFRALEIVTGTEI